MTANILNRQVSQYLPLAILCLWMLSAVVQGHRHSEPGQPYASDRLKRVNSIACPCCANSFNTGCCMTCLQGLGKRSGQPPAPPAAAITDSQETEDSDEDKDDYMSVDTDEVGQLLSDLGRYHESKSWACKCCKHLVQRFPKADDSWPCCGMCMRKKRSAASGADAKER